jgi:hypothetical protein
MHVGVVNGAEYAVFGRSGHGWDGDVSLPAVCRNQCGGVFLDASFQKCWHHVGCGCQCSGGNVIGGKRSLLMLSLSICPD